MNNDENYVFPDKPAYGVPETVDYTKLSGAESFLDEGSDCHDGPGFDNEAELPESDYPEVGDDSGEPADDSV